MDQLLEFAGNNLLVVLLFFGILIAIVINELATLKRPYKPVSVHELTGMINRDETVILDVRSDTDFNNGHIVDSAHVLPSQVTPDIKALKKRGTRSITLVCKSGRSASMMAAKLHQAYAKTDADAPTVYWLDGGITAWRAAEMPTQKA